MQKPLFLGCLVQVSTLKRSWNKISNRTSLQESDKKTHIESFRIDLDQFRFNPGDFQQCIESDPGFQILNDEEIMQTIQDRNSEEQCHDEGDKTEELRGLTDTEAFNVLEVAMEWVKWQDSITFSCCI